MKENNGLDRMSSGIRGLDVILQGGFFRGGLYVIQGTPGTGKTTLANQICFNHVAGGNRAIYVTLLAEYHARMVQSIGRMSFFDESKIPDQLSYFSGFHILREEGLTGLLTLVRREIIAKKVSVLSSTALSRPRGARNTIRHSMNSCTNCRALRSRPVAPSFWSAAPIDTPRPRPSTRWWTVSSN